MKVYCNTCEKIINEEELIAQFSESDPSCPECGNDDFSDIEELEEGRDFSKPVLSFVGGPFDGKKHEMEGTVIPERIGKLDGNGNLCWYRVDLETKIATYIDGQT